MAEKKPAFIAALIILASLTLTGFPVTAHALEPVVLDDTRGQYPLGHYLEYYEDKSAKLTIQEISSPEYDGEFMRVNKQSMNFGQTRSAIWVRFRVQNNSVEKLYYLESDTNIIWDVRFFIQTDNTWEVRKAGFVQPFKNRDIVNRKVIFKFPLPEGESKTFYMSFKTITPMVISLKLWNHDTLIDLIQRDTFYFAIVFGILFFIFFFNIGASLYIKEITYLYLALYIIMRTIFYLTNFGFSFYHLWPDYEVFNGRIVHVCGICSMLFYILFVIKFSDARRNYKIIYYALLVTIIYFSFLIMLLFINPFYSYKLTNTSAPFLLLFFLFLIIVFFKSRNLLYFNIGNMLIIIGELFNSLKWLGSLPSNQIVQIAGILPFICTSVFFTFSIIQRYKSERIEREKAQAEALRIQQEAVETLEGKVEQRTKELAHALEEVETINERLTESNARLEGFGATLRRYLPLQLVDSIIRGGKVTGSHTERRKLTVFFSDIKAFTDTTDSLESEELSSLLNEYLTEMTAIAMRHGGTIDKFVGDAIMIFFGAPESRGDREDALRCLRMAVVMQARMKELQKKWFEQGIQRPLQIRIGINTGVATVGDFGAEERLSYTAIGGQVNLASRLESLCEPGKILISHPTWALVKDEFPCTPRGEVQVKGIHHEVLVYEVGMG